MPDALATFRLLASQLARRAIPCHQATTAREFEAIARMRYAVQVRELNVTMAGADHERERVWGDDDERPGVTHFYAGSPEQVLGCLRVRAWAPGQVPPGLRDFYSMDMLPGLERLSTCDVTRLIVRPDLRGTAALASLSSHAMQVTIRRHQTALMFAASSPGLLRSYQALGLRLFGGRPHSNERGLNIPLLGISHDLDHLRRIGSPWYATLRQLRDERLLPPDLPEYREIARRSTSVILDHAQVVAEMTACQRACPAGFLRGLSPEALAALGHYGLIVDVPDGLHLCHEGVVERELYLVVQGEFDVRRGAQTLGRLGPGDVFGEVALLSDSGQHTAAVVAATPGRVVVLRRKFLRELRDRQPRLAFALNDALVQTLVRKLERSERSVS